MHPDLKPGLRRRFEYTVPAEKTVPYVYREFGEFQQMPAVFATAFLVGQRVVIDHARFVQKVAAKAAKR